MTDPCLSRREATILAALALAPLALASPSEPSRASTASVEIVLAGERYLCAPQPLEPSASDTARIAVAEAAPCGSDGGACGRAPVVTQTPACVTPTGDPAACGPGTVRLLEPGRTVLPAGVIDGRGARLYQGACVPSSGCCPLWRGVAAAEVAGAPTWAATWGLGVAVLRAGAGLPSKAATSPDVLAACPLGGEGWLEVACRPSEQLNFLGRPAIAEVAGGAVIAVPGVPPAGVSFWRWRPGAPLRILYQDAGASSLEAAIVEVDGRLYAATSALSAAGGGLYDLTAALALAEPVCERCAEGPSVRPGVARSAPGVRLGALPGGSALDVTTTGSSVLLATSGIGGAALWRLEPTIRDFRTVRVATLPATGGIAWLDGATLAAVEGAAIVARDWSTCVAGGSCSPPALWSWPIRPYLGDQPLQASRVGERWILHRGTSGLWVGGAGVSHSTILEVSAGVHDIGRTGNAYLAGCSGEVTDAWGWMAPRSERGTNAWEPHDLACVDRGAMPGICIRAAESALDVLALPEPPPPPDDRIFSDGFEGGVGRWSR